MYNFAVLPKGIDRDYATAGLPRPAHVFAVRIADFPGSN